MTFCPQKLDNKIRDARPEEAHLPDTCTTLSCEACLGNCGERKINFYIEKNITINTDFHPNYIDNDTHSVRDDYPDFLILAKDGEWLVVEVRRKI